ncbi:interleukin-21 receptor [Melanotaenia boesemani]|uniref:interleukin-21 receptor n=1 Tax=Melanotaenia boesemani TaxID=1250792 RepID=UPI001C044E1E|nr:interleukin-21 receptor [Melanotaenia boesemani]
MDLCPLLRLKVLLLTVFLFKSTTVTWLQADSITGVDGNLHCFNDYLYTVNCSLKITPENNSACNNSYRLTFTETQDQKTFECVLTNTKDGYFCSIITLAVTTEDDYYSETFTDSNVYEISLCHHKVNGSDFCELLDEKYYPEKHIKPNMPCCLTVRHNSSQHHFTWKSTYEEYSSSTLLTDNLQFQLIFYKTGNKHEGVIHINTDIGEYSVNDEKFVPDTDYAARVRSSPNMVHYTGQWSDWSSEVLWKTEPAVEGLSTNTSTVELRMVFIALCMMAILVLLLCFASVKKWRQGTFIPTPAPYFHTLYTDCKGDFKSWVITQENTADMLKAEETLQIDTLIKGVEIQEDECPPIFQQHLMEGSAYNNIPTQMRDSDLLSMPYTDDSIGQEHSVQTLPVFIQSGSPAEDSGCWLCSDTSLEKEPPWYCNEYCTLSCFQQSGSDHPKCLNPEPCPARIISVDAFGEA